MGRRGQMCPKCGTANVHAGDLRSAAREAIELARALTQGATEALASFRCDVCRHGFEVDLVKTMDPDEFDATNRMRKRLGFPPLRR